MKKIFSFLTLAAALLCSGNVWAGNVPTWQDSIQGKGTEAEPYLIDNYRHLVLTINNYGGHVKLTKSFDMKGSKIGDISIRLSKTATIDLNGFTISNTTTGYETLWISSGGSITVTDNTVDKKGCVKGSASEEAIICIDGGEIFINEGTIKGGTGEHAIFINGNGSSAEINGGHIESAGSKYALNMYNSSAVISGGYFKGDIYNNYNSGIIDIKGGYFATKPTCTYSVVAGKDIVGNNDAQTKTDYPYCLRDIKAEDKPFVSIGSTYFMSVDKAIASQISGDILLLRNATYAASITTPLVFAQSDSTLTINGNYKITDGTFRCKVVGPTSNISGGTFYNKVTSRAYITGGTFNGAVDATAGGIGGGTYNSTVLSSTIGGTAIFSDKSTVTASGSISGGTFNCTTTVVAQSTITNGFFATLPSVDDGKVSGGRFTGDLADTKASTTSAVARGDGFSLVTKKERVDGGKLISGGSYSFDVSAFVKEDYSQVANSTNSLFYVAPDTNLLNGKIYTGAYKYQVVGNPADFLADGYCSAEAWNSNGDFYFVGKNVAAKGGLLIAGTFKYDPTTFVKGCVASACELVGPDAYGEWHIQLPLENAAASIKGVPYLTLSLAFTAAKENDTIVLLRDIVEAVDFYNGDGINCALNLNGHTLSSAGSQTLNIRCNLNKTLTIFDGVGTGSITNTKSTGIVIQANTNTYKGVTKVVIQGGTFIGATAIKADSKSSTQYAEVTVEGGKFSGSLSKGTYGKLIIKGGSYKTSPSSLLSDTYDVDDLGEQEEYRYVVRERDIWYYEVITGSCTNGSISITNPSSDDNYKLHTILTLTATPDEHYKLGYFMVNGEQISGNKFEVTEEAEVTAVFVHKDYICKNTSTNKEYESLKEAVSAVKDTNNEIILYKNIDVPEDLSLSTSYGCTVNLKGHTINLLKHLDNFTGDSVGSQLRLSGKLIFKNGTIKGSHNYVINTSGFTGSGNTVLSYLNFEDLSLNGGFNMQWTNSTFKNCFVDASNKAHYAIYLSSYSGTCEATIYSGSYAGKSIALSPSAGTTITLYGGFYNSEPSTSWLADGYSKEQEGGLWRVVKQGTRPSVTLGNIGTICLPAAVAAGDYTNATFYQIAYKDNGKIFFDQVDNLEAGHAYVFEPTATGEITYKMGGDEVTEPIAVNGLIGTLVDMNYDPDNKSILDENYDGLDDMYLVSGNKIQRCGLGCALPAQRAYIDMKQVPEKNQASAPAPGRRRISLIYDQVNTPTGVVDVNENANANGKFILNGKLVIIRDGKKFNAQGAQL